MTDAVKELFASAARHVPDPDSGLQLDAAVLNECLEFALQWGNEMGQKTRVHLIELHADLTPAEVAAYDDLSRKAMLHGHRLCYDHASHDDGGRERWLKAMRGAYGWVSQDNLGRIYSQGSYFAWREGLSQRGRDTLARWTEDRRLID